MPAVPRLFWHGSGTAESSPRQVRVGRPGRASCLLGPARGTGGGTASAWWRVVGWVGVLAGVGGCLGELLGESLVLGSCGVEVGFCSFGADAERGSCFFERGDAGVCGGAVLVAFAAGVGSDEGDFLGGLGLGAVGPLLCGGLGLLRPCGFLLRVACLAGGLGDLALGFLAGLADVALRGGPCEFEVGGRLGAELAELLGGGVAKGGEFVLEFFHAGDRLGGGVVGLLAVGAGLVALGLGFATAVDLLGEEGLGGRNALVSGGTGGVDLSFGGLGTGGGAQLGDGAGEGVGVLGGELFELADEFGGAGEADGDGLAAGFLGSLAGGVGFPLAALAVGVERVVAGVVAVFRLRAAVVSACGYGLLTSGIGAVPGGGLAHVLIYQFHCETQ